MRTFPVIAILMASAALLALPMRGGMVGVPAFDPALVKVAEAYRAGVLAGDAAAVAAVFREDAVEMPPGNPPVKGRAAIEQYYRGFFGGCRFQDFTLSHTEVRTAGDVGFLTGVSSQTLLPGGGPPIRDTGKYLVILKRTGAEWKVAYAIYNADHPMAGPPPASH